MYFTRISVNSYYDADTIQKFYDLLSKEFDGLELRWYSGAKQVDSKDLTNRAVIKKNGKNIFIHSSQRSEEAIVILGRLEGKEKQVLKAMLDSGYSFGYPSLSTPVLCLIGFIALQLLLMAVRDSDIFVVLAICNVILFSGIALYSYSMSKMAKLDYTMRNIASVIFIIGLLPLAPSSLLTFPLVRYINRRSVCNYIDNL